METSVKNIGPETLKKYLHDGKEIALLDAREEVVFDSRHLFMASCVPLSRMEMLVGVLVPRRETRVVWCDDGEGLASLAAERMAASGCTDVSVLDGGVSAWESAGYQVYKGVHVPSKAFAEVIEHEVGTPWITVAQFKALADSGADLVLLDSRTYEEFSENSIPGAISVPGAELVLRFTDLVPSPDTTVVVHCGGRTRSIIGAQSLIDAGFPNKIVSMKNGTQGWQLAGFDIVEGTAKMPPDVSSAGLQAAIRAAKRVADRFAIEKIDASKLEQLRGESFQGTTYLIDVRTREEFEAGHLPCAKHVAGGQLIQETERHLAVWGASVVLVDDNGVRATMTASWLKQMGWSVFVFTLDSYSGVLETGAFVSPALGLSGQERNLISPVDLLSEIEAGEIRVIDLAWSRKFFAGHIPGAWWAIRSRLEDALGKMPPANKIALTSTDGTLARLAAGDLKGVTDIQVFVLAGGTDAWKAAGFPVEAGRERLACAVDDIRLKAREQEVDKEQAMRDYLAWELGLVAQLASDNDHRFLVQSLRA